MNCPVYDDAELVVEVIATYATLAAIAYLVYVSF
jgi:hypothetical protein